MNEELTIVHSEWEISLQLYPGIGRALPAGMLCPAHFVSKSKRHFRIQQPAKESCSSTQQATALGNLTGEIDCYPRYPSAYY